MNKIKHKYGEFSDIQFEKYKKHLHSSIHWLLVYKDPNTVCQWKDVDVDKFIEVLLLKLNGLNSLLGSPESIVTLMSVLESARIENAKPDFDWPVYRKLILDAHNIVECLPNKPVERR